MDLSVRGSREESGSETSKEEGPVRKYAQRELGPLRKKDC